MKKSMTSKTGFTLVEIMIVVAIIALLAAMAIPNLLRVKVSANDTLAKVTIRAVSTAAENYAAANNGNYPENEGALTSGTPPYLNKAYCGTTMSGYVFTCNFSVSGYTITATPVKTGSSGTAIYAISTGGVLTP